MRARAVLFSLAVGLAAGGALAQDAPLLPRDSLRVLAVLSAEETFFVAEEPRGGFDWEMLEGFARVHKLKLELVPVNGWDDLIPALVAGRGDVIAGGFTATAPRRKQIAFTVETFPTRSVVITRGRAVPPRSLADLKAERIGTLKGSFMLDDLRAAGVTGASIDDSIETGQIPAALKAGRITAGVDGIEAALVAKAKDPELQIGPFVGAPASLAYGVRKADTRLLAALDEHIADARHTPTWNRLAVKYFGPSAPEILKRARGE
jgi:ABC-type amino acid transport substrate-binding protein